MRSFNLKKALGNDSEDNLALQEMDSIAVTSVWDIRDRHSVAITGSVRKPGTYEYLAGMTVMDLIFRAGGPQEPHKMQAESRGRFRPSPTWARVALRRPSPATTPIRRFDVRAPSTTRSSCARCPIGRCSGT